MSGLVGAASGAPSWDKVIGEEISFLDFLLCQPLEIIANILKNLNPGSLKNLAFTCKPLFNACLGAKGVQMVFVVESVEIRAVNDHNVEFGSKHPYGNRFKQYLEKLGNWPFSLEIEDLELRWRDWEETMQVQEYFKRNKVSKIHLAEGVRMPETVQEMGFLTVFLKEFNIQDITLDCNDRDPLEDIFEACLKLPVNRFTMQGIYGTSGDGYYDSILSCNIPNLHLDLEVDVDGFEALFDMWMVRNDITNWKIGFDPSINFLLFFDGWDIRDFDSRLPLDPTRRTVFIEMAHVDYTVNSYYLRRADGKVLHILVNGTYGEMFFIEFRICTRNEIPRALRGI